MKLIRKYSTAYIIFNEDDGDHVEIKNVFETDVDKFFTAFHYEEDGVEKTVWYKTEDIYSVDFTHTDMVVEK